MRHEDESRTGRVFVAIDVTMEGAKEVLGLWTSATERAKLWLQILTSFPSEESALMLLCLALWNIEQRWRAAPNWRTSLNHFLLLWGDRIEASTMLVATD